MWMCLITTVARFKLLNLVLLQLRLLSCCFSLFSWGIISLLNFLLLYNFSLFLVTRTLSFAQSLALSKYYIFFHLFLGKTKDCRFLPFFLCVFLFMFGCVQLLALFYSSTVLLYFTLKRDASFSLLFTTITQRSMQNVLLRE